MRRFPAWLTATSLILAASCGSSGSTDDPVAAPDSSAVTSGAPTTAAPDKTGGGSGDRADLVFGVDGSGYPPEVTQIVGFDPIDAGYDIGSVLADALWDSLTVIDADGRAQPSVATSWSSDDQRVWVFQLDPDARYHDGTPLTAADFVWAISRFSQHPDAPLHYLGQPIAGWGSDAPGLRAIDDHTLEITTEGPFPLLPEVLGNVVFSPRPITSADDATPPQNGPYQVVSQAGLAIVAERNGSYQGERSGPDTFESRVYPDSTAYRAAVEGGEIDFSPLTSTQVAELGLAPERLASGGAPVITFVDFNNAKAPTDDPRVRRALSLAIDRDALLKLDGPGATAATGWAPPVWEGAQGTACDACVADAEAARAEFARSGLDPATVTIELASFQDGRGEAVAQMWRDVLGVTVTVDDSGGDPTGAHAMLAGWFPDYPATGSYLAAATSRVFSPPSADTVSLIESSLNGVDAASRLEALAAAQAALADELVSAPMSFVAAPWYVGPRVKTMPFDAMSLPLMYRAEIAG